MNKKVLLLFLLFSCTPQKDYPVPFTTDNCSWWFDGIPFYDPNRWAYCCRRHDLAYWKGGTYTQKVKADNALYSCVVETHTFIVPTLMWSGVQMFGGPYTGMPYRWGYAWPKDRGYKALDEKEQMQIDYLKPNCKTPNFCEK